MYHKKRPANKPVFLLQIVCINYDFLGASFFASLLHSLVQFFLSLQQAAFLAHFSFFLQQALSCANAPPEIIATATNNNVSFFIAFYFCMIKIDFFVESI